MTLSLLNLALSTTMLNTKAIIIRDIIQQARSIEAELSPTITIVCVLPVLALINFSLAVI